MIKSLRMHFIKIYMFFFTLILLAILLYVYISSAYTMQLDSFKRLEIVMDRYNLESSLPDRGNGLSLFSFEMDDGKISKIQGDIFLMEADMIEVFDEIKTTEAIKGEIKEHHIRYLINNQTGRIFIIDMSYEDQRLFSLAMMLTIIGIIALIIFYLLSLYLASIAIVLVEKAWRTQNSFMSNASHELKTPLAVMIANTELLAASEDKNNEKNKQRIKLITKEASRMKRLVEEMMFLARSDEKGYKIKKVRGNISDLVTGRVLMFESIAYDNGIRLFYDVEPNIQSEIIEDHVKRLVDILLDNAIKYTPDGYTVKLSLQQRDAAGILLSVSNAGVHIPPEDIEHIFDRFYKSDRSRHDYTESFGLGLSIAAKICEEHGGRISCESTEQQGVTFTVEI